MLIDSNYVPKKNHKFFRFNIYAIMEATEMVANRNVGDIFSRICSTRNRYGAGAGHKGCVREIFWQSLNEKK